MELRVWLAKNQMEVSKLAEIVDVSRQVIWKAKNNIPISEDTAKKIEFVTGGCVKLKFRNKGRRKKL